MAWCWTGDFCSAFVIGGLASFRRRGGDRTDLLTFPVQRLGQPVGEFLAGEHELLILRFRRGSRGGDILQPSLQLETLDGELLRFLLGLRPGRREVVREIFPTRLRAFSFRSGTLDAAQQLPCDLPPLWQRWSGPIQAAAARCRAPCGACCSRPMPAPRSFRPAAARGRCVHS